MKKYVILMGHDIQSLIGTNRVFAYAKRRIKTPNVVESRKRIYDKNEQNDDFTHDKRCDSVN